jgi:hypothetical protein
MSGTTRRNWRGARLGRNSLCSDMTCIWRCGCYKVGRNWRRWQWLLRWEFHTFFHPSLELLIISKFVAISKFCLLNHQSTYKIVSSDSFTADVLPDDQLDLIRSCDEHLFTL